METKTIRFHGWDCRLVWGRYTEGGRLALQLVAAHDVAPDEFGGEILDEGVMAGEPVATATVNVPEVELAPDEVLIKNYSENEGLLDVLVAAGIVESTGRQVESGYVTLPVCRLLITPEVVE